MVSPTPSYAGSIHVSTCKALQALLHVASLSAGVPLAFRLLVGEDPEPAMSRESYGEADHGQRRRVCICILRAPNNSPSPLHVAKHAVIERWEPNLMLLAANVDHVALLVLFEPLSASTIRVSPADSDRDSLASDHFVPSAFGPRCLETMT